MQTSAGPTRVEDVPVMVLHPMVVLLPGMSYGLRVGKPGSVAALEHGRREHGVLGCIPPDGDGVGPVGVVTRIDAMRPRDDGAPGYDVELRAHARFEPETWRTLEPYRIADVRMRPDPPVHGEHLEPDVRRLHHRLLQRAPKEQWLTAAMLTVSILEAGTLADTAARNCLDEVAQKRAVLETLEPAGRLRLLLDLLPSLNDEPEPPQVPEPFAEQLAKWAISIVTNNPGQSAIRDLTERAVAQAPGDLSMVSLMIGVGHAYRYARYGMDV